MTHTNESDVNLIWNMFIYLFVQVFIICFVAIDVFWLDLYEKKKDFPINVSPFLAVTLID